MNTGVIEIAYEQPTGQNSAEIQKDLSGGAVSPLKTNWDEIIHAAITLGRNGWPLGCSLARMSNLSSASYEVMFRVSLLLMAVEESDNSLKKTKSFMNLDPTEKGMASYFLGMTFCNLFASHYLQAFLLHIDVYGKKDITLLRSRSRPDLFGWYLDGDSYQGIVMEAKGRSNPSSKTNIVDQAKKQLGNVFSINGAPPALRVVGISDFDRKDEVGDLRFFWKPLNLNTDTGEWAKFSPYKKRNNTLPEIGSLWKKHYELAIEADETLAKIGVAVTVHEDIKKLYKTPEATIWNVLDKLKENKGTWEGYSFDGICVRAKSGWFSNLQHLIHEEG